MHWILQENMFREPEWDNFISALDRLGLPYSEHRVIPFVGELVPPAEPKDKKVICFGSYGLRHEAKRQGWNPGVYDLEPITFPIQLQHWGKEMLNHDSQIVEFMNIKIDDLAFIRPIDDSKHFAGNVFDPDEISKWQENLRKLGTGFDGSSLTPYTLCQVSSPKKIYSEYRYWIINRQVITRCMYKRGDRVIYSQDVDRRFDEYVNKIFGGILMIPVLQLWMPHRAFVFDICETEEGIKIVEINTINSAGLYAAHVVDIISALENMEKYSSWQDGSFPMGIDQ